MRYIKDLAEGNKIQGIYYCKSKLSTETKNGKPYESVMLQDKTGMLDAKVWEPYSPAIHEYEAGDYIEVTGDVIMFNNARQAKLSRIRRCREDEYDPADYMPMTRKNIDGMYTELLGLVDSVSNPFIKRLLDAFFRDEAFAKEFKKASAAKTVHHGFIGGLLEHSLNVASLCSHMCEMYPVLNRNLLVGAALLHDVGKVRELSAFPENDYTDEGQLLGHIIIGAQMVAEQIRQIEGFPAELSAEIQHCILAHHGELEYGSPKKPAIIEALALNLADNMDAKIETFTEVLENNEKEGWLGYNKFLDSNLKRTRDYGI
ncbi:MAG: HD domain-containing protein [Lachnospiraceae bacterium]|nr:HD domain-containing protein [Lachnospiraceae bacterium]